LLGGFHPGCVDLLVGSLLGGLIDGAAATAD
jgi:hypothetical protein